MCQEESLSEGVDGWTPFTPEAGQRERDFTGEGRDLYWLLSKEHLGKIWGHLVILRN